MAGRRFSAIAALVLFAAFVAFLVVALIQAFPRGLLTLAAIIIAIVLAALAVTRRGSSRLALLAVAAVALVAAVVLAVTGDATAEVVVALVCLGLCLPLARRALAVSGALPPAPRPERAVVIWNPRSGGGKAVKHDLPGEARKRGIEPIELKPGDDLVQLVNDAVARGADALAAAGGDGTQALVASIAAAHDLPFACIPAGTRNHFALDLGVDRNDVVGALDAFVSGGERRVDLAEVNGRVFVNNVSLGLYAEAVQRTGYRDAKLRTILDTVPDIMGTPDAGATADLRFTDAAGAARTSAAVILVSNNAYRLGRLLASGTRPTISGGRLGIAVMEQTGSRIRWTQWTVPEFEVGSSGRVPTGVDGEALVLDAPLRFISRPGALRVRLAPQHPGVSPAAGLPPTLAGTVAAVARIAARGG
jgi:diacylglycerol kinase family enzyme